MLKRSVLIFLIILLTIQLVRSGDIPSPVVVEGFITDAIFSNTIEKPIVSITVRGNSIGGNTAINSNGNHAKGHYDGVITGLTGDSVSVSAYDKDNPNCRGEVSKLLTGDGKLIVDVPICCYPTSASNLKPDKPLHLTSSTEVGFSWTVGSKGKETYPDFWQNFKGPQSIADPANPLKLTLSNLDGWSIQTCNGIKGTDKFCCSEKSVGVGYQNHPCNAPTNLNGEFKDGFVVTKWDSESKDSDGDDCHDEWKASSLKEGDALIKPSWASLVTNANKAGELAAAYLVTFWQVRSCDDQNKSNSCSGWVDAITVSCNKVNEECPDIKKVSEYLGGYGTKLSGEIYCNGIKINDSDLVKRLELRITPSKKEINILGLSSNKYNIDYCPWCYDKIKDYDEEGIDCGGSCQSCFETPSAPLMQKNLCMYYIIVFLFLILLIVVLLYVIKIRQRKNTKDNREYNKETSMGGNGFFNKLKIYFKRNEFKIYNYILIILFILTIMFFILILGGKCIVFSCIQYMIFMIVSAIIIIVFAILCIRQYKKIRNPASKIVDIIKDIIYNIKIDKKFRIYVSILILSLIFFIYLLISLFIKNCINVIFLLLIILILIIVFLIFYYFYIKREEDKLSPGKKGDKKH